MNRHMKKIFTLILFLSALFAGCSDYLDQDAEDMNTIDKVFSSRTETREWFDRLYSPSTETGGYFMNELEGSQYNHPWLFATDDAVTFLDWHLTKWYKGTISPSSFSGGRDGYDIDPFYRNYQAIRHACLFLENVDKSVELTESEKENMIAEAKFMRAMYHFWALRCCGPIPVIESSLAISDAGELKARNSMDECVAWLVQQFDDASQNLQATRTSAELGFPTQTAALAMKSRLLLMDASPLYNGNTVYANWKNNDGKQLINQTYDAEKWQKAADAAMACITQAEAAGYKLKTPDFSTLGANATAADTFNLYVKNYREITTEWNDELIWARPQNCYFYLMNSLPGAFYSWWGGNAVSLELVNNYFMDDGSNARDAEEWFANKQFSQQAGNGTIQNTFWMFCNREPRFYASLHFPNMQVAYPTTSNPDAVQICEFWATGNSGYNNNDGNINYTGFSIRKHIPLSMQSDRAEGYIGWEHANPFPVIRLAEIYLNYCEAVNEYNGESGQAEVLKYLNPIRERAGIPGYTGTYTQEEMREMIRHERRIELAWEDARFFDVRRWFIAHGPNGVFNTPVHGLNYTEGSSATDPDFFSYIQTQGRTFRIEHYFYPISSSEVAYNSELVQAPFY